MCLFGIKIWDAYSNGEETTDRRALTVVLRHQLRDRSFRGESFRRTASNARSLWIFSLAGLFHATQAVAGPILLSDLQGYSIDATIPRVEQHRELNAENSDFTDEETIYREQIYISPTGRIFERQGYENRGSNGRFDAVTLVNDQRLRFEENFGFRRFNYDGGGAEKSTYIMITSIPILRDGSVFLCDASISYLLGRGQKAYIKHIWNGQTLLVRPNSWSVHDARCEISEGNLFVGQAQKGDCARGSHSVQKLGPAGLRCAKDR